MLILCSIGLKDIDIQDLHKAYNCNCYSAENLKTDNNTYNKKAYKLIRYIHWHVK